MPPLQLSTSHHERREGLLTLRAVNVYWDGRIGAMFSRPAMQSHKVKGVGPCRGMFYQASMFNDDRFFLSGTQMYREDTIITTHAGTGPVRFAAGLDGDQECLIYCVGGLVYRYMAGAVTAVAMPLGRAVSDVAWFGNRFLYFSNDAKFYWSEIADPTNISLLSFATAELNPDALARAVVAGDRLYLIGYKTIETWYATDDITLPFQPSTAAMLDIGAVLADTVLVRAGRVYFISDTRGVYLLSGGLTQLADDSVLEALSEATATAVPVSSLSLALVDIDGVEFLMITDRNTSTYVYDGSNWYRWHRFGKASMNIFATVIRNGKTYAGDMTTGEIFQMNAALNVDADGPIERITSGYLALAGGVQRCHAVTLQSARGPGNGAAPDPQVDLRYSDDGGNTFTDWWSKPLGKAGEYFTRPKWVSLGMMRPFGRVFEFRCTADADFTPQAFTVNETRM